MSNMHDNLRVLRNEFEAGEGSFLIQLRVHLDWDKLSFTRLDTVMQQCCEEYRESETLERWMASGFWYMPSFIRDWTTHPSFPRIHDSEYYLRAYKRLDDLAYWFFIGESPYMDDAGFERL